jgi:hypothetical protein
MDKLIRAAKVITSIVGTSGFAMGAEGIEPPTNTV